MPICLAFFIIPAVTTTPPPLPWLTPHDPFPPVSTAWGQDSPLPGLLAAGAVVDAPHLQAAYQQGIFPWFSAGQPPLWWSPDPRMVLQVERFRLHRSLRQTLKNFQRNPHCSIRIDHSFRQVMQHCAATPRPGQDGTWIVPSIIDAYCDLHAQGLAHSVETWIDGELVGGLYCVALGRAVYGESMFAHQRDASKIALAALVALCRSAGVVQIDCQQATQHLASLGAAEMPRDDFLQVAQAQQTYPAMHWQFSPHLWATLGLPTYD